MNKSNRSAFFPRWIHLRILCMGYTINVEILPDMVSWRFAFSHQT